MSIWKKRLTGKKIIQKFQLQIVWKWQHVWLSKLNLGLPNLREKR